MTSHSEQIRALLGEIDDLLRDTSPRWPWMGLRERSRHRDTLENLRGYLAALQNELRKARMLNLRAAEAPEELPAGSEFLPLPEATLAGAIADRPPSTTAIDPSRAEQRLANNGQSSGNASGNLPTNPQAVLEQMVADLQQFRLALLRPLQEEVMALQHQRDALQQEVQQIQTRRQAGSAYSANQEQLLREFLQALMGRLQERLVQQVTQTLQSTLLQTLPQAVSQAVAQATTQPQLSAQFPAQLSAQLPPQLQSRLDAAGVETRFLGQPAVIISPGSEPNITHTVTHTMTPVEPSTAALSPGTALSSGIVSPETIHLEALPQQVDRTLMTLDHTLHLFAETLEQNLKTYQHSLGQGLEKMHSLGRQGEVLFNELVNRLAYQLETRTASYLQGQSLASPIAAAPLAAAPKALAQPNPATLADAIAVPIATAPVIDPVIDPDLNFDSLDWETSEPFAADPEARTSLAAPGAASPLGTGPTIDAAIATVTPAPPQASVPQASVPQQSVDAFYASLRSDGLTAAADPNIAETIALEPGAGSSSGRSAQTVHRNGAAAFPPSRIQTLTELLPKSPSQRSVPPALNRPDPSDLGPTSASTASDSADGPTDRPGTRPSPRTAAEFGSEFGAEFVSGAAFSGGAEAEPGFGVDLFDNWPERSRFTAQIDPMLATAPALHPDFSAESLQPTLDPALEPEVIVKKKRLARSLTPLTRQQRQRSLPSSFR